MSHHFLRQKVAKDGRPSGSHDEEISDGRIRKWKPSFRALANPKGRMRIQEIAMGIDKLARFAMQIAVVNNVNSASMCNHGSAHRYI